MTSASELFSTRRSRSTRSDPDSVSVSSSLNRHHSHHHHNRRLNHRHESSDACDPHRRGPPRLRRFCHLPGRRGDLEIESSNGFGNLNGSDNRLPGSVLLARARLVERLRGVSLSSNRGNRVSLGDEQMELNSGVGFSFYADANFQPEVNKKPQGLTQVAISCLHRETFSTADVETETRDCSICLESFVNGDVLIALPCRHSFHSSCLNPWLRACGDCPYCRRAIA